MWAKFERENNVAVATSITELIEFVDHIVSSTNMSCLTTHDRSEKGSFLAANLQGRPRGKFCFARHDPCRKTLVRVRYCLLSASCLLNQRGHRIVLSLKCRQGIFVVFQHFANRWLFLFILSIFRQRNAVTSSLMIYCFLFSNHSVFGEDAFINASVEQHVTKLLCWWQDREVVFRSPCQRCAEFVPDDQTNRAYFTERFPHRYLICMAAQQRTQS